jgi:hypothetical protein
MSFAPTCVTLNPNGNQNPEPFNNSCAWLAGNYSTEAESSINTCCGPSNPIYYQNLMNAPRADCYQICEVRSNGTSTELAQNGQTLFDCLNRTLHAANVGHPYCTFNGKTVPETNDACGMVLGWVKIGVVVVLVGTALGGW